MPFKLPLGKAVFAVLLPLIGLASASGANPDPGVRLDGPRDHAAIVGMTDRLTFTPERVTVELGASVRWENSSALVHTVTADPELASRDGSVEVPEGAEPFNSGNLKPGASFSHEFGVAGTYTYFCIPHEGAGMIGTVIVEP